MLGSCLAGVRILDVSQWLPGPHAGLIFADFGADVVKIEPPSGDRMRGFTPKDKDGVSAFYNATNSGKRILRLDLKTSAGSSAFRRLAGKADILLESFRPGALRRLGFSRDVLREINPALIHVALSGWGQTGPYALRAGHDVNYLAVGGSLIYSGNSAAPMTTRMPVADFGSALTAVIAALSALYRRANTGQGAFVDVSIMESVLAWQAQTLCEAQLGAIPPRGGALLSGGAAHYNVYRTNDGGFVSLGALEPEFWKAFCTAVGRPGWIERQNEPLPQSNLIDEVSAMFAEQPRQFWQSLLDPVDCCFESVLTAEETLAHRQIIARGLVQHLPGRVEVLFPAYLDDQPPRPRSAPGEIESGEALERWDA
jgi:alpha-methylacyl-CoA racemase